MFVDCVTLTLTAGSGGNGIVAWRREKYIPKGGPYGGNGGRGGSIVFEPDSGLFSLESFRHMRIARAKNGQPGGTALKQGRSGEDLILKVPFGTQIKDAATGEILYDFTEDQKQFSICQGGKGGKGNAHFRSPTHQAPNVSTPGTPGETRTVQLELKLIADIGLIGMPNAGKSTLLSKIAPIEVKIGAYPFTTLHPNLSFIQLPDLSRLFVADIPGIIENAHKNKGLGLDFLKHVERTSILVYVIDVSGQEDRDPYQDFQILRNELKAYREEILDKPFLVALNKIDQEGAEVWIEEFKKQYPFPESTLFPISASEKQGLTALVDAVCKLAVQSKVFCS